MNFYQIVVVKIYILIHQRFTIMKIALFADLHGRILLAFKLIERLQKERNIKIDLVLQCGDLGVFPTISNLDKATLRHAKRDTSELGFYHHFTKKIKK